jgi:hypothetical protein
VRVNNQTSLKRTKTPTDFDREGSGWTWYQVTKLWHVKLGFTGSGVLETKTFALRAKGVDE